VNEGLAAIDAQTEASQTAPESAEETAQGERESRGRRSRRGGRRDRGERREGRTGDAQAAGEVEPGVAQHVSEPAQAAPSAPVAMEVAAPQAAPVAAPIAAPVASVVEAPVAQAPAQPQPALAPIEKPAPASPPIDLSKTLAESGLVMIETQNAAPTSLAAEPAPQLGRRRPPPAVTVTNEPLVQIETQSK
jgi:ribonuclease E